MKRMTVTIDEALLDEAKKALGTRTKRETIATALREVSRRARLEKVLEHQGKLDLGLTREELLERREDS